MNRAYAHEQGTYDFDTLLVVLDYKFRKHLSVGALQVLDHPRGIEFWAAVMQWTVLKEFMGLSIVANLVWDYSVLRLLLQEAGPGIRRLDISLGNIEAPGAGRCLTTFTSKLLLMESVS